VALAESLAHGDLSTRLVVATAAASIFAIAIENLGLAHE
jgi:hypothetical protein